MAEGDGDVTHHSYQTYKAEIYPKRNQLSKTQYSSRKNIYFFAFVKGKETWRPQLQVVSEIALWLPQQHSTLNNEQRIAISEQTDHDKLK